MNRHAFDLVIFDCDGVLIDSEIVSCGTIVEIFAAEGIHIDLKTAFARYLGRPTSAVTDDYSATQGHPPSAEFIAHWRSTLFDSFRKTLEPISGIRETLESLPIPFCLASSSDAERIDLCLRKTGLKDMFDERAFTTEMVVNGKPSPDLFLYAAGRMACHPARCLVIEDSPSGIRAAKAAGMTAWGFTGGSHYKAVDGTENLIGAGADRIITDMQQLKEFFCR